MQQLADNLIASGFFGKAPSRDLVYAAIIFVMSLVVLDAVERLGLAPAAAAGHSLGEYTALVAAGALSENSSTTFRQSQRPCRPAQSESSSPRQFRCRQDTWNK